MNEIYIDSEQNKGKNLENEPLNKGEIFKVMISDSYSKNFREENKEILKEAEDLEIKEIKKQPYEGEESIKGLLDGHEINMIINFIPGKDVSEYQISGLIDGELLNEESSKTFIEKYGKIISFHLAHLYVERYKKSESNKKNK